MPEQTRTNELNDKKPTGNGCQMTDEEAAERFGVPGFSFDDFSPAHLLPLDTGDAAMARIRFKQAVRANQRKMIRTTREEL